MLFECVEIAGIGMWQTSGMGAHGANNPWMKLMGIVQKERRGVQGQGQSSSDRGLNQ